MLSICAYACAFDFTKSPFTYMMYLLYFRRGTCHNEIQWETLGIDLVPVERLDMPHATAAVLRTFTFSIFYLVLNLLLILAAFRAMCKLVLGLFKNGVCQKWICERRESRPVILNLLKLEITKLRVIIIMEHLNHFMTFLNKYITFRLLAEH